MRAWMRNVRVLAGIFPGDIDENERYLVKMTLPLEEFVSMLSDTAYASLLAELFSLGFERMAQVYGVSVAFLKEALCAKLPRGEGGQPQGFEWVRENLSKFVDIGGLKDSLGYPDPSGGRKHQRKHRGLAFYRSLRGGKAEDRETFLLGEPVGDAELRERWLSAKGKNFDFYDKEYGFVKIKLSKQFTAPAGVPCWCFSMRDFPHDCDHIIFILLDERKEIFRVVAKDASKLLGRKGLYKFYLDSVGEEYKVLF